MHKDFCGNLLLLAFFSLMRIGLSSLLFGILEYTLQVSRAFSLQLERK